MRRLRAGGDLKTLPFHPFLLLLAIVGNFAVVSTADIQAVIRPMLIGLTGTGILLIALWAPLRSVRRAALLVDVILIALVSKVIWVIAATMVRHAAAWQTILWMLLIAAAVVLAVRIAFRMRRQLDLLRATVVLNGLTAALSVLVLAPALVPGLGSQAVAGPPRSIDTALPDDAGRDIILLMLDGYPRRDTLERHFDLDNGRFIEALEARNFNVAARNRSNYTSTHLTLMSMLQMSHVQDIPAYQSVLDGAAPEDPAIRRLIGDNPVFATLRGEGYEILTTPPGIERVNLRSADEYLDSGDISEFEYHLLRSTAIGALWALADPDFMARSHHGRVLSSFQTLNELQREPAGKRLIFAHVLSPHMPAVFNRDGSFRSAPFSDGFFLDSPKGLGISQEEFIAAHRDQLLHLNTMVIETVDEIVALNPDAIVVIMSDHGSASHFTWDDPEADQAERLSNFFAARTPGRDDVFSDWQTPVNVFPDLFNAYFGTNLPLAPDDTYTGVTDLQLFSNPDVP